MDQSATQPSMECATWLDDNVCPYTGRIGGSGNGIWSAVQATLCIQCTVVQEKKKHPYLFKCKLS